MPRKPVRGRFSIVVPLDDDGGSWRCESFAEKSITAREMVVSLREYADFIEKYFVRSESATPTNAVDPVDRIVES